MLNHQNFVTHNATTDKLHSTVKAHGVSQYSPAVAYALPQQAPIHAVAHGIASYAPPQGGGYATGPSYGGGGGGACGAGGGAGGLDFNPALLGGIRGAPGIKAKINQRGFQYFSSILAPILGQEIQRARIPPISQAPPLIPGCIQVYNIYVSRFRCPQRVAVYPAPPNQIVIAVQNFDIGLTGNLGGMLNIIIPINLFGIIQINAHQVTVMVQLAIERGPYGGPNIRVVGCSASVGYLDVYVQNGGLIGDIANSGLLRGTIIEQVRGLLPSQICSQIPSLVNEKINSKLGAIPQSIPLTTILQFAGGALGLGGAGGIGGGVGGCGGAPPPPCHAAQKTPTVSKPLPLPIGDVIANNASSQHSVFASPTITTTPKAIVAIQSSNKLSVVAGLSSPAEISHDTNAGKKPSISGQVSSTAKPIEKVTEPSVATIHKANGIPHAVNPYTDSDIKANSIVRVSNRVARSAVVPPRAQAPPPAEDDVPAVAAKDSSKGRKFIQSSGTVGSSTKSSATPTVVSTPAKPSKAATTISNKIPLPQAKVLVAAKGVATAQGFGGSFGGQAPISNGGGGGSGLQFVNPGESSPCGGCPGANDSQDPLSIVQQLVKYLDFSKLNDISLNVQLLQSYATLNDYSIALGGEFSQNGQQGCSPFNPFPMEFPCCSGDKMAEAMISDFTLNTLFYSLHKKGFLSARIGPETPKIGPLLKTTCSHDDEIEDGGSFGGQLPGLGGGVGGPSYGQGGGGSYQTGQKLSRKIRAAVAAGTSTYSAGPQGGFGGAQQQPQSFGGAPQLDNGLGSLEICLGDIFPTIGQRFPNRNIYIVLHTSRAPSVILSARNGGTATIDLAADADLFTDRNERIGTIRIEGAIEAQLQTSNQRLTGHAQILNLRITNPDQSLGIQQQTLDTFTVLGRELVDKAANSFLQRGIPLQFPSGGAGGLPLNFISPEIRIIEHGIYLQSDFTISPSFIAQLTGSGGSGGGACLR
uniref:Lipid-binding serum glycoprotein C-terminal domain-containing protein n=1 Tax=Panagrolaimus davidi TaxID=227884 RepID=A0A914QU99_9BILA